MARMDYARGLDSSNPSWAVDRLRKMSVPMTNRRLNLKNDVWAN